MRIAGIQLMAAKGDIETNIKRHLQYVEAAVARGAAMVFFPELSLTGYEPALAAKLATTTADERLSVFGAVSNRDNIVIAAGLPVRSEGGIGIGMVIYRPGLPAQVYRKQHLHEDEFPFFVNGQEPVYLDIDGIRIAPAICYESLLPQHAGEAAAAGAGFYVACVAKSAKGVTRGRQHYPEIAAAHQMQVMMVNATGPCDDYLAAGSSAVWNKAGVQLAALGETDEGMIFLNTETGEAEAIVC